MRLTTMDISFKFTAGKINVEQTYHIEFAENDRTDLTGWIRDKATLLEQAGFEPAVVKQHTPLGSAIARQHGATGTHPDDLQPELMANGRQRLCPECSAPLYRKRHVFKSGRHKGQAGFIIGHEKRTDCKFVEYEN